MSFEQDLSKHLQKTLNKAISKAQKEQAKLIREDYDIPLKKIKNMTSIKKASAKNLKASIRSLEVNISLKNFKRTPAMQGNKVVGVNVKLNKKTNLMLKGHFIAKSKTTNGEFIATRENSKHQKVAGVEYKKSKKSYPTYNGSSKLLYPLSVKTFSKIASEKTASLAPRIKEIFMRELDK